jgi:hypothetical protein
MEENYIKLGLSNYYGSVYASKEGDKYFLNLDDVYNTKSVEISEELFLLIKKEFNKN